MTEERDVQRQKLYDAEISVRETLQLAREGGERVEAYGSTLYLRPDAFFGQLAHVQEYVDRVLALPEVAARWPQRAAFKIRVRHRKGNKYAHYSWGEIAVHEAERGQSWGMRELVVLHEIAHHLTPGCKHGPIFTREFLALVEIVHSSELAFLLKMSMYEHGVQISI